MATVVQAGTTVNYTFENEFGKTVTRDAVLATASDGTSANAATLVFFNEGQDEKAPTGTSHEVAGVPQTTPITGVNGFWALPSNPPYAQPITGATGATGPTGPAGPAGPTGPHP
jgi:hypothetical protein